jgi:hypothetical protein
MARLTSIRQEKDETAAEDDGEEEIDGWVGYLVVGAQSRKRCLCNPTRKCVVDHLKSQVKTGVVVGQKRHGTGLSDPGPWTL